MKVWLKNFFVYLNIFLLLGAMIPAIPTSAASTDIVDPSRPTSGQVELISKRTENTKTYLKSDGSKQLVASQDPIHYKTTVNGKIKYEDIDVGLKENSVLGLTYNDSFSNKANNFSLNISKKLASRAFTLSKDGVEITEIVGDVGSTQKSGSKLSKDVLKNLKYEQKDNRVTYKNVVPGTDVTFYSMANGIKEYITLNSYNGQNVFSFDMSVKGGYMVKATDGSINIYSDATKSIVFVMPQFFMWDSAGGKDSVANKFSYDVKTELTGGKNSYRISLSADNRWLSSKDRVFPVYIDPSFDTFSAEDTYIQSSGPGVLAYNQGVMWVGLSDPSYKGLTRAYLKMNLPDLTNARINDANIGVYQYGNCYGSCTGYGVWAYRVGNFDPWAVTWNNRPGEIARSNAIGYQLAANGWLNINITDFAKHWFEQRNPSGSSIGGIMLAHEREDLWGYRSLAAVNSPSYEHPRITINYNDYNAQYCYVDKIADNYCSNSSALQMFAGNFSDVPMTIINTGRNTWDTGSFKLSYHWIDNSTGEAGVIDGERTNLPRNVGPGGDSTTVLASVKAPPKAGSYTIQWDMIQEGVTWFKDQAVPMLQQQVTVSTPSFDSMTHLAGGGYATNVGPVDLATGGLGFSSTDVFNKSNGMSLGASRSYNSNLTQPTFDQDTNGFIRTWLFNGPYKNNDPNTRLTTAYIKNENTIQPSEGSSSNGNVWKSATEPNTSQMWLNWAFYGIGQNQWNNDSFGGLNNSTGYAQVYVYSPFTRTVQLRVGSDDGVQAWLNGAQVLLNDAPRGYIVDSDVVTVTLNAGWNSLLSKVSQWNGLWQLSARFLTSAGLVIPDLKYSVQNPEIYSDTRLIGNGWSSNLAEKLIFTDTDNIYYVGGSGSVSQFILKSDGTYQTPAGSSAMLIKEGVYYKLQVKSGMLVYFDSQGRKLATRDLNGNYVSNVLDSNGRVVKIVDSMYYNFNPSATAITTNPTLVPGRYFNVNYDSSGRVQTITNQAGEINTYGYDLAGRLSSVSDPLGFAYAYTYGTDGRLVTFKDKNGSSTAVTYTGGKVTALADALGNITSISYDGRAASVTDPNGNKSSIRYADANMVSSSTDARGYTTKYMYDKNFNVIKKYPDVDPSLPYYYAYKMTYDSNNNLLTSTDPLGKVSKYEYNADGDLIKETDPAGKIKTYAYSLGRRLLLTATDTDGTVASNGYDAKGRLISTKDKKGAVIIYSYDALGNMLATTTAKNERTSYAYDVMGRITRVTSPLLSSTTYTYDKNARVVSTTSSGGQISRFTYDNSGNKLSVVDAAGHTIRYQYDANGKVISITDEAGAITRYTYDKNGNMTKLIDAKGNVTAYTYDALNHLISSTDEDGNVSNLNYDPNGSVTSVTDGSRGTTSQATYNKAGQVVSATDSLGTTGFTYDATGNVSSVSNSGQVTSITRDSVDRAVNIANTAQGSTSVAYDANGNTTSVAAKTATLNFTYDANSQVTAVNSTQTGATTILGSSNMATDSEGKVKLITKGNGDTVSLLYDLSGRMSSLVNKNKLGVVYSQFTYGYDTDSNRTSIKDVNGNITNYAYDIRGQLLSDGDATYTYDITGNRQTMVTTSGVTTYAYAKTGNTNRLVTIVTADGRSIGYEYDKSGNATRISDSNKGSTIYEYDADNYFTKATLPNGDKVVYTYDKTIKRRTQRDLITAAGITTTTKFVYDGDKLISETDAAGNILTSYTWDENESLMSVAIRNKSGALDTYEYIKNTRGDVIGLSDKNGIQVVEYSYDSWGNVKTSKTLAGASTNYDQPLNQMNKRLYASYWYDSSLGLYYMKTRMYNPTTGRFLSKDQVKGVGVALLTNTYIYVANSPISKVDPSGKSFFGDVWNWAKKNPAMAVGAAVGFVAGVAVGVGICVFSAGTGCGAVGAVGAIAIGAFAGAIAGGVAGGVTQVVVDRKNGRSGTGSSGGSGGWDSFWNGFGRGAAGGAVGGAIGAAVVVGAVTALKLIQPILSIGTGGAAAKDQVGEIIQKTYTVYTSTVNGVVEYVGRTGDFASRQSYWASQARFVTEYQTGLTYAESRGLEQLLIEQSGGIGNLSNAINGISANNPNLTYYISQGLPHLK